jgi:hypothetical protein
MVTVKCPEAGLERAHSIFPVNDSPLCVIENEAEWYFLRVFFWESYSRLGNGGKREVDKVH